MSGPRSSHIGHDKLAASLQSYITGFVLSLALTLMAFATVMSGIVPQWMTLTAIVSFAVAQLLVQLVFFLHLGTAPDQRSKTAIFAFTGLIIATIVAGSLWVMHNANLNMMPTQMSIERARMKD